MSTTDTIYRTRPADAGQLVRVEYALTDDGEHALRRTADETGAVTVERSEWPLEDDWTPYAAADFAAPPVDTWIALR